VAANATPLASSIAAAIEDNSRTTFRIHSTFRL
jgi:hypothetical protein